MDRRPSGLLVAAAALVVGSGLAASARSPLAVLVAAVAIGQVVLTALWPPAARASGPSGLAIAAAAVAVDVAAVVVRRDDLGVCAAVIGVAVVGLIGVQLGRVRAWRAGSASPAGAGVSADMAAAFSGVAVVVLLGAYPIIATSAAWPVGGRGLGQAVAVVGLAAAAGAVAVSRCVGALAPGRGSGGPAAPERAGPVPGSGLLLVVAAARLVLAVAAGVGAAALARASAADSAVLSLNRLVAIAAAAALSAVLIDLAVSAARTEPRPVTSAISGGPAGAAESATPATPATPGAAHTVTALAWPTAAQALGAALGAALVPVALAAPVMFGVGRWLVGSG